jgi:integrase
VLLPKPWYRPSKKAWYLQVSRGVQQRLGKTKAEADAAYRQRLLDQGQDLPPPERRKLSIAEIAQEFLDHTKKHTKPKSYASYCYFVVPFVERFGKAPPASFPPLSFTRWLDDHAGCKGSRRNAIIAVKRLFNWAVEQKMLAANPLSSIRKPPKKRRNRVLSDNERLYVYATIRDQQFRDFVFAMLEPGCRPSEVMHVTAADVSPDFSRWTLAEHKTDRLGEDRIVYLTPALQELTKKLIAQYPQSPLFRCYRKCGGIRRQWTANGIRCRFRRLREKVASQRDGEKDPVKREAIPDLSGRTAYVLRHTFATQALLNGVPGPMGSSLLVHRSLTPLDTYSHVGQAADELG